MLKNYNKYLGMDNPIERKLEMPKLKMERDQQILMNFKAKINQRMITKGLNCKKEVAEKLRMPSSTLYDKLHNPNNFTLSEIIRIMTKLEWTDEDIVEVFGKRPDITIKMPSNSRMV